MAVRVRPLSKKELARNEQDLWRIQKARTIYVNEQLLQDNQTKIKGSRIKFTFDHCFESKVTNKQVYAVSCRNVALSSLQGINGTIFMYGQTGSGKTYSMIGDHDYEASMDENLESAFQKEKVNCQSGVLILSLAELFSQIEQDLEKTFMLSCEYVEIYNDKIYDLLGPQEQLDQPLAINEDIVKKDFYIKGVT